MILFDVPLKHAPHSLQLCPNSGDNCPLQLHGPHWNTNPSRCHRFTEETVLRMIQFILNNCHADYLVSLAMINCWFLKIPSCLMPKPRGLPSSCSFTWLAQK